MKSRQEQPNLERKEGSKVISSGDIIIPNPESLNNWEVLGWEGEEGKGSLRVEETVQDKNKEGKLIIKKRIVSIPEKNLPRYLEAEGVKIEKHSGIPRDLHEGDVITTGWGEKKQEYKISEVKVDPDNTESGGGYFEFSRKINGTWTNPAKISFKDFYEKRTEPIEFIDKYNEKPKAKKEVPAIKPETKVDPGPKIELSLKQQIDKFVSETTKRSYDVHLDEEGWVITKNEDGRIMKLKPEEWERFRDRNKLELKQESQKSSKKEKDKKEKKSPGPTTRKGTGGKGKDYRMGDNEKEKAGPPKKIADLSNLVQGAKTPEGYMEMLKAESLAKPEVAEAAPETLPKDPILEQLDAIDERLRKYLENNGEEKIHRPWNLPNVGDIITSRGGINRRVFAINQDKELIGLEQVDTGDKTQMTFTDYEKSKENIHNIQGRKKFDDKYNASRQELSQPEMTLSLESGQSVWTPGGEEVKIVEVVKKPQTADESLKNGYAVLEFQPKQNTDGTWRNEKVKREVVPFHKLLWAYDEKTLSLERPSEKTPEPEIKKELFVTVVKDSPQPNNPDYFIYKNIPLGELASINPKEKEFKSGQRVNVEEASGAVESDWRVLALEYDETSLMEEVEKYNDFRKNERVETEAKRIRELKEELANQKKEEIPEIIPEVLGPRTRRKGLIIDGDFETVSPVDLNADLVRGIHPAKPATKIPWWKKVWWTFRDRKEE